MTRRDKKGYILWALLAICITYNVGTCIMDNRQNGLCIPIHPLKVSHGHISMIDGNIDEYFLSHFGEYEDTGKRCFTVNLVTQKEYEREILGTKKEVPKEANDE